MTSFASPDELAILTGNDVDDIRAQLLLDIATASIQAECGQTLSLVEDDEIDLVGTFDNELFLPERPVASVSELQINGFPIDAGNWTWSSGGQLYRGSLLVVNGPDWDWFDLSAGPLGVNSWGGPQSKIHVKYTHGFDPIPNDLKGLCLELAKRALTNPQALKSETIGNYSYTSDGGSGVVLTADEKTMLRERYGRSLASLKTSG